MKSVKHAVLCVTFLFCSTSAFGSDCPAPFRETFVTFINGITNTATEATASMDALERAVRDEARQLGIPDACILNSFPMYNPTEGFYIDLKEVGGSIGSAIDMRKYEEFGVFLATQSNIVNSMSDTLEVFANVGKQRIVIVAHSQGNIIANDVYRELVWNRDVSPSLVSIVSVATPDNEVAGRLDDRHMTSALDFVIASLWSATLLLPYKPLPGIVGINVCGDVVCHGFLSTYMKEGSEAREKIMGYIMDDILQEGGCFIPRFSARSVESVSTTQSETQCGGSGGTPPPDPPDPQDPAPDPVNLKLDVDIQDPNTREEIYAGQDNLTKDQTVRLNAELEAEEGDAEDWMDEGKDRIETDFYVRYDDGEWTKIGREYTKAENLDKGDKHTEHVLVTIPGGVHQASFYVKTDAEGELTETDESDNVSRIETYEVEKDVVVALPPNSGPNGKYNPCWKRGTPYDRCMAALMIILFD